MQFFKKLLLFFQIKKCVIIRPTGRYDGNGLRKQVFQRVADYDKLIDRQYRNIDIFCKSPIVKWNKSDEKKSRAMESRIVKYIDKLNNEKHLMYDLIMPLDKHQN